MIRTTGCLIVGWMCCLTVNDVVAGTEIVVSVGGKVGAGIDASRWKLSDSGLVGSGRGLLLNSGKRIGRGDAAIHVRLSIAKLDHTAASLVFGDSSHFGFDGNGNRLFVEGPLFGGLKFLDNPNPIRDGQLFRVSVVRKDEVLTVAIDDKQVFQTEVRRELGRISLRPHRSTMHVSEFSLEGDLMEPPKPPEGTTDLFVGGQAGYHTYRIPVTTVTTKGTILAFCEGRKSGRGDAGDIDMVLRRSEDGGNTWLPLQTVWDDEGHTCGNASPVVDATTGTIWLLLTWNHGKDHEGDIMAGTSRFPRRPFICKSEDDGKTWTVPVELPHCRKEDWRWYATGPVNGIQLERGPNRGRLVIPANHSVFADGKRDPKTYFSHILYSDDHGESWAIGGIHENRTNESTVVELSDGTLMQNMRAYYGKNRRAVATSADGGVTWSKLMHDDALVEPVCQASILRYSWPEDGRSRLLFSNPASKARDHMTVRISYDEGKSWPVSRLVHEASSAYSNLVKLPDGRVGLLFERDNYTRITFVPLTLDWIEGQ